MARGLLILMQLKRTNSYVEDTSDLPYANSSGSAWKIVRVGACTIPDGVTMQTTSERKNAQRRYFRMQKRSAAKTTR